MKHEIIKAGVDQTDNVARLINAGEVGVIPTDTVYGLAAHPAHPEAVERLYTIKAREAKKPIALLASSIEAIAKFGYPLSGKAKTLAAKYWPGALTLVVENETGQTEGFRIPGHEWTRSLIEKCGGVLRVTSANVSGGKDSTLAEEALAQIGLSADFIVDDGPSGLAIPSTVVKVEADGKTTILRRGALEIENQSSAANNIVR